MTRSVDEAGAPDARRSRKPFAVALPMVALIVAFDLLREHGGHVAGLWPYLLLLACPLMHLFHGHGRHGRHGSHAGHGPDRGAGGG
jgi:Protein of unknown function (DUF2933)